jgi:glycosyltransferase involved in cell wall biosynthesis
MSRQKGHRRPKFSVAIATRNYGRWLTRCLDSVLQANNRVAFRLQIVVVDDCSTDNTAQILERFRNKYPELFTTVRLNTSHGVSAAKNEAIRRCAGEYVALLDADDEFVPEKLARCHEVLKAHPDIDLLTHDYTFVDECTGETFVPGNDWYGAWRPPGVWVFRSGCVLFSEQMICGYEELEWSKRFWYLRRRFHIPESLAIVHGQSVSDRWKVDREIAGVEGMERWNQAKPSRRTQLVFACRGCGNQYFNAARCCGRDPEEVPLVHYMAVSSFPYHRTVEFSVIVFTKNGVPETRSLSSKIVTALQGCKAELIFVHCHARRALLDYLRILSNRVRVKAVFAPRGVPFVYSHDVNRAARAADGRFLLLLDNNAQIGRRDCVSSIRAALNKIQIGIVSVHPKRERQASLRIKHQPARQLINHASWALRRELFWELGALDESLENKSKALRDLEERAGRISADVFGIVQ